MDNTALVQEIKTLIENATGANCKYTERKIQELTKTLSENLGDVNDKNYIITSTNIAKGKPSAYDGITYTND